MTNKAYRNKLINYLVYMVGEHKRQEYITYSTKSLENLVNLYKNYDEK